MKKEEYIVDILGMCEALEAKPEYRQEIIKDFNGKDLETSVRESSRDKLRNTASLAKVYLTEYVKSQQSKCDNRIRKIDSIIRGLKRETSATSYTRKDLGLEGEFQKYYNGKPLDPCHFNGILRDLYIEKIELLKLSQELRRLAQRYIRKNIPCMAGDSIFDDRIVEMEKALGRLDCNE